MPRKTRRSKLLVARSVRLELLEDRAVPALFNVSPSVPDGAPGSLRDAISQANRNQQDDLIQISAGTYEIALAGKYDDANLSGDLDLTEAGYTVTIRGAGANATTIDGNQLDRVLHVVAGRLVLEDVRVTGGRIRDIPTPPIDITTGTRMSTDGGGIYAPSTDSISAHHELRRVWIDQNTATYGGGLSVKQTRLDSSTVSGNYAFFSGGGAVFSGIITNSTISGNRARGTGGISVFTVSSLSTNIDSSTITNNASESLRSSTSGIGGIFGDCGSNYFASVSNSIVAGNSDSVGDPIDFGCIADLGNNLLGTGNVYQSQSRSQLFTNTPLLGLLHENGGGTPTHLPLAGSLAIDAVSDVNVPDVDQRGISRPQNGLADIGAVEVGFVPTEPQPRAPQDVNGNGLVTIEDALAIVQELRRSGARSVDPHPDPVSGLDYDVTGDGRINISDALEVIRAIILLRAASMAEGEPTSAKTTTAMVSPMLTFSPLLNDGHVDDSIDREGLLAEWSVGH